MKLLARWIHFPSRYLAYTHTVHMFTETGSTQLIKLIQFQISSPNQQRTSLSIQTSNHHGRSMHLRCMVHFPLSCRVAICTRPTNMTRLGSSKRAARWEISIILWNKGKCLLLLVAPREGRGGVLSIPAHWSRKVVRARSLPISPSDGCHVSARPRDLCALCAAAAQFSRWLPSCLPFFLWIYPLWLMLLPRFAEHPNEWIRCRRRRYGRTTTTTVIDQDLLSSRRDWHLNESNLRFSREMTPPA